MMVAALFAALPEARAAEHVVKLPGEMIGAIELAAASGPGQLGVFTADDRKPTRRRLLNLYVKSGGELKPSGTHQLWDDAAGFDRCRLAAGEGDTLLYIRPTGIFKHGSATPVVSHPTFFRHARDDGIMRVRLCFDLFAGEAPAILVPVLDGVAVFRHDAAAKSYKLDTTLQAPARQSPSGQLLRADDTESMQRVVVRIEFPDVVPTDFNGDGLKDICMNRDLIVRCAMQVKGGGFKDAPIYDTKLDVLSPAEEKDSSLNVSSRLVEFSGDGRVDLVVQKSSFDISSMNTQLQFFVQQNGAFANKPSQVLARKGYFAFQEYIDLDGDGLKDLVAPTAALGWTELAGIFFSRSADVEFVWYKNTGGKFAEAAKPLHSLSFPVEFKNVRAITAVLPLWNPRFKPGPAAKDGERRVLFTPGMNELQLVRFRPDTEAEVVWQSPAKVGTDMLDVDLDGDGNGELIYASPRDPARAKELRYFTL
jgi:hypothetical protein